MAFRNPARFLAPLALVACAVALLAVVQGSSSDAGPPASDGAAPARAAQQSRSAAKTTNGRKRHRYVVKPGDTLSSIAVETGVSVDTLERLNPSVDAQALHAGQKIDLSP
jgi:LysM repeat protein